ncbi:MAG: hypothetical protein NTX92_08970 [Euryarchaeota archaeon]|nr:hypothetical protein [Euryarchaeota archaeon]
MQLFTNHEIIGTIIRIVDEDGLMRVFFSIERTIDVPENAIPKEVLQQTIGKRVGILNIDGKYHVRTIPPDVKENKTTSDIKTFLDQEECRRRGLL